MQRAQLHCRDGCGGSAIFAIVVKSKLVTVKSALSAVKATVITVKYNSSAISQALIGLEREDFWRSNAAIRLSHSIWGILPVWVLTDKRDDGRGRAALVK